MAAVLEDALTALERDPDDREVWEWVAIRGSAYIHSFETICESLSLDAEAVRQALKRWYERTRRRAPTWRGRGATATLRYLIVGGREC